MIILKQTEKCIWCPNIKDELFDEMQVEVPNTDCANKAACLQDLFVFNHTVEPLQAPIYLPFIWPRKTSSNMFDQCY